MFESLAYLSNAHILRGTIGNTKTGRAIDKREYLMIIFLISHENMS